MNRAIPRVLCSFALALVFLLVARPVWSGLNCTITCPANITQSNDPNQCGAVVTYPAPTTTGNCGTINCSPASGSFFPVGTTTVNCTAQAGPTCSFTVTVNDTQPPTITCPANINAAPAGSQTLVTYPPPTASDNCPGVSAACNPPSGSLFPVGNTTVTCTATDASGNTATCSFSVALTAPIVPTLSLPGLIALGLLLAAVGLLLARNRLSGG